MHLFSKKKEDPASKFVRREFDDDTAMSPRRRNFSKDEVRVIANNVLINSSAPTADLQQLLSAIVSMHTTNVMREEAQMKFLTDMHEKFEDCISNYADTEVRWKLISDRLKTIDKRLDRMDERMARVEDTVNTINSPRSPVPPLKGLSSLGRTSSSSGEALNKNAPKTTRESPAPRKRGGSMIQRLNSARRANDSN